MTSRKQIRKTRKSVDRAVEGITNVALAGLGATVATGLGAGLIGALHS